MIFRPQNRVHRFTSFRSRQSFRLDKMAAPVLNALKVWPQIGFRCWPAFGHWTEAALNRSFVCRQVSVKQGPASLMDTIRQGTCCSGNGVQFSASSTGRNRVARLIIFGHAKLATQIGAQECGRYSLGEEDCELLREERSRKILTLLAAVGCLAAIKYSRLHHRGTHRWSDK